MTRRTPPAAVALIRKWEGYHRRLPDDRAAPYLCPAGIWTIGYGSTRGLDGGPVTAQTPPVTREQAEAMLSRDLAAFEVSVLRLVRVPMTDGQFGALVSFCYNLGAGRLQASSLLRRFNAGDVAGAADEFGKWVMAGGRQLPGLVARRAEERAMFMTADSPAVVEVQAPQDSGPVARFMSAFRAASQ